MERKVGARGLRMILEDLMLDLMYYLPSYKKVREFQVTKEMVLTQKISLTAVGKGRLSRQTGPVARPRRRTPSGDRRQVRSLPLGRTMLTSKEKSDTKRLPMMPIRDVVIFPYMMTPFVVGRESSVRALEEALAGDKKIFLATQHDASVDEPAPGRNLHRRHRRQYRPEPASCRTATSRFWWKAWSAAKSSPSPTTRASSAPSSAPPTTRSKPARSSTR